MNSCYKTFLREERERERERETEREDQIYEEIMHIRSVS
mgnify:CR=1 FL=1